MAKPIEITVRAKRGTPDTDIQAAAQQAADRIKPGLTLTEISRVGGVITYKGTRAKEDPTPKDPKGEQWPHPAPASHPTSGSVKPYSAGTGEQA